MLKQAVGKAEEKSEIVVILNKYNNTLDDLIESSDTEFLDWLESLDQPKSLNRLGLVDKRTRNTPRSRDSSPTLLKEDCNDVSVISFEWASKI